MRHTFAALVIACLCLGISRPARAVDQPFRVEARSVSDNRGPAIEFTMTNTSVTPLTVFESDLPWMRASTSLVALPVGNEPLRPRITSEDQFRSPPTRTLKPGESTSGRTLLSSEFQAKDVHGALAAGRLIVFWYYAPRTNKGESLGEYGGWIAVPREQPCRRCRLALVAS